MPHESRLTADIPLGPFEGVPIKVFAARGAKAKLHANERCSSAASATAREVKLDKDALAAMCLRCAEYGPWEDRSTGAGVFLDALQGVGLLYQLALYTGSDEEEPPWEADELKRAEATLQGLGEIDEGDDDEDHWDQVSAAGKLRDLAVSEWRGAATSMAKAVAVLAAYTWLREWAQPKLSVKVDYIESVRAAAQRLLSPRDLCVGAVVASMETPELPVSAPELSCLGDVTAIRLALQGLWRRWSGRVEDEYSDHSRAAYLAYSAVEGLSSRNRARGAAIEKLTALIKTWEADASHTADATAAEQHRTLTIKLNEKERERSVPYTRPSFGELTDWETAAVLTYQQAAIWESRSFVLNAPPMVADRLLRDAGSTFQCTNGAEATEAACENAVNAPEPDVLGPGAFDDSRVADRRAITAADLKMYSAAGAPDEQLQLVFAPERGVEVITLQALRRRCNAGWAGAVIATETSLPASIIDPWVERVKSRAETADSDTYPSRDPEAPDYAARLGILDGEDWLVRLSKTDQQASSYLRALALARSVPDLRMLADSTGERRLLHRKIWMALLSRSTIDLSPFRPVEAGNFRTGSGLPLGPLADVQIYASNLSGDYVGKSHSPFCAHSTDEVREDDEMATLADLLQNEKIDRCSKCGGYAVRRLSEPQLSYYRCAQRAQEITERWTCNPSYRPGLARAESDKAMLDELEPVIRELSGNTHEIWWQWREVIARLRQKINEG